MDKLLNFIQKFAPPKGALFLFWLPAAIMAAAGLVQTMVQRRNDKKNIQRQQAANAALSAQEFAQNQAQIKQLNQYNDPSAQMARLGGAGLNPNLIYGSGASGASGNQTGVAQFRGRETDMRMSPLQIPEIISQYQDFSMKQAQIDNVKAQTQNTNERTTSEPVRRALSAILGDRNQAEIDKIMALLPSQASAAESTAKRAALGVSIDSQKLGNLRQDELLKLLVREEKTRNLGILDRRSIGMGIDNERKAADLLFQRYKNEWIKAGVTTSDDLLVRMFARMLTETGLMGDIGGAIKDFIGKYRKK